MNLNPLSLALYRAGEPRGTGGGVILTPPVIDALYYEDPDAPGIDVLYYEVPDAPVIGSIKFEFNAENAEEG